MWVSSDSSSNFMDVSHWESTGWPVCTAMTSGAAWSTGSSDIAGQVNSLSYWPCQCNPWGWIPASFLETGQLPWGPQGVAAGLSGLGPGAHPDMVRCSVTDWVPCHKVMESQMRWVWTLSSTQTPPIQRWMGPNATMLGIPNHASSCRVNIQVWVAG